MNADATAVIIGVFMIFCRIGSCLMVLPGYSNSSIPAQIRLFIAFGVSLAVAPGLLPTLTPLLQGVNDDARLLMLLTEVLNGLLIGLLGRIFLIAVQFGGSFVANAIGMGQAMGVALDENGPEPAVVSLITLTATVLIFSLNLHAEILRALVASYTAMPVMLGFAPRMALASMVDNLDMTFKLCLRIASPFVVYAVIVNFAIGLANKMTPQIPIYFISLPFVIAGGLTILYFAIPTLLSLFADGFVDVTIGR